MATSITDAPAWASDLVLVCPGGDQSLGSRPDERLHGLFEEQCDRLRDLGLSHHPAVDGPLGVLTYAELDRRANRLARLLLGRGLGPGDRLALLVDRAVDGYVAMLAVSKIHAAYVPMDPGFPPDRLAYIVSDSGARVVLSVSGLVDDLMMVDAEIIELDALGDRLATMDAGRLTTSDVGLPVDDLCYIIYTSGSTGRPKGVAIEHASICNFIRVAAAVYGLRHGDRVYQGMTIAFDFSVEEIWVPWACGATLVPKPVRHNLVGPELQAYLQEHRVDALVCVPTLLATLDERVTDLRFILVSGEACPRDLVTRWHRPGRRFLNVYGPTEATVTATWTPVDPDRPVTIGVPLPTYSVVILDPDGEAALPRGRTGEIGIAGIGLSAGYVNRPELTQRAFVPDFLGIPDNPSGRIYRTGDLGRVTTDGEIEFLGRIDTQVKLRGYRIELTEIESVVMEVPGVANAVVNTFEPEPGATELVAYYSVRAAASGVDAEAMRAHLRTRLPAYMVPAYLEPLPTIPMLPSGKADRKHLPAPRGRRASGTDDVYVAPATPTEAALAHALAAALCVDRVSVDDHVFDDLGANSLLMARVCARVRTRGDLPAISMRDVYLHPRVRELAAAVTSNADDVRAVPPPALPPPGRRSARIASRRGAAQYVAFGAAQALLLLVVAGLVAVGVHALYRWISAPVPLVEVYVRAMVACAIGLLVLTALPVAAKWALVGRWRVREIPLWSLTHFRFWVVKSLIQTAPVVLYVGSPLYVLYLRALGARVGRGVVILSRRVPVCTDLLTIGSGTVIRRDAAFACYRAQAGMIRTGPVTIGRDAVVGEMSTLDVHVAMGDGSQLGHASCLLAGQSVPAGDRWHGSPAQPTQVDYGRVSPIELGRLRPVLYTSVQLLNRLLVTGPLTLALLTVVADAVLREARTLTGGEQPQTQSLRYLIDLLLVALILYFGALAIRAVLAIVLPRALNLMLLPDRVYPVYGVHYSMQRAIARLSNVRQLNHLFGDSSAVVHYLRALSYDLSQVEQTGSNFGLSQKHDVPSLVAVGHGSMVSDGVSFVNAVFSSTSFRVSRATLGARCFVGNNIAYPAGARVGDNCLLGTKVMVPTDGPVRQGVGLLGSPAFEIPRSVERDSRFDKYKEPGERRRRLRHKNRHNLVTASEFLLARWIFTYCSIVILTSAFTLFDRRGAVAVMVAGPVLLAFGIGFSVLVERAGQGFRGLQPEFCSIYEAAYWRQERLWKLSTNFYLALFNGTPLKILVWRMLGVRVGRRVFDDGCYIPERTLVTIGDGCVLNAHTVIQCHSLEDGTFKSEPVRIGSGCVLGTGSFVHYGVTMGDGAVLEADAFLMKGSELAPGSRWLGNPAREVGAVNDVGGRPGLAVPAPETPEASSAAPGDDLSWAPADVTTVLDDVRAAPDRRPFGPSGPSLSLFSRASCRCRSAELLVHVTDAERDRARRMRSPERREAFLLSRALLRLILTARFPAVAPREWDIVAAPSGKPQVQLSGERVEVSLSHTLGAVAIAVSTSGDVGVDLESLDSAPEAEVARSFLTAAELASLGAALPADLPEVFLRYWTLKEATAKALGEGAALDFRDVDVSLRPPGAAVGGRHGAGAGLRAHAAVEVVDGDAHVLGLVVRPWGPPMRRSRRRVGVGRGLRRGEVVSSTGVRAVRDRDHRTA
jgi:non-ribosomal peptide synthetase-like protein